MISLDPFETSALILSLKVSLAATAGALPLSFAIAWILARLEFPLKWLLDGLVHIPLVVPPVVIGYLLLLTFAGNGSIGRFLDEYAGIQIAFRWTGAALAAATMAFPLMVRAIRLSLEGLDPRMEAAARTLGAGWWDRLVSIVLPSILPGIAAAIVLGFARALGEFGATITFVSNIPGETQTLPLALYTLAQTPGGEAGAARLAVLSILLALAALVGSEFLARRLKRRISGTDLREVRS